MINVIITYSTHVPVKSKKGSNAVTLFYRDSMSRCRIVVTMLNIKKRKNRSMVFKASNSLYYKYNTTFFIKNLI